MIKRILILLITIGTSLSAKVEFASVFYLGDEGSFSLVDSETGEKSGWLQAGQSFQGYRIESYDRTAEVLRLVSSGERVDLNLRPSAVKAERITIRGNLKIGARKEIAIDHALIVVGEEARFPIDDRTWMKLTVERTQREVPLGAVAPIIVQGGAPVDGNRRPPGPEGETSEVLFRYNMVFEEENNAGEIVTVSTPRVSALPGHGFSIQDGKYSFTYEP